MNLLKIFDRLKKHITTEEVKAFRVKLKHSEIYANKLDIYFTDTLDEMEPERSKK